MFHLEIVADTAVEFADKVRDLAAQFGITSSPIAIASATEAPADAEQPAPVADAPARTTRRRARTAAPAEEQAAEQEVLTESDETDPPAETALVPQDEPAEEPAPTTTRRRRSAPAEQPAEQAADEPEANEAKIRTLVLDLMRVKGGPAVRSVLDGFKIQRATEIDEARAPKLVAALEEALAA